MRPASKKKKKQKKKKKKKRERETETDRHIDRQTDRQTDRERERERDREREREREREKRTEPEHLVKCPVGHIKFRKQISRGTISGTGCKITLSGETSVVVLGTLGTISKQLSFLNSL